MTTACEFCKRAAGIILPGVFMTSWSTFVDNRTVVSGSAAESGAAAQSSASDAQATRRNMVDPFRERETQNTRFNAEL
jgi:hypothetical protein